MGGDTSCRTNNRLRDSKKKKRQQRVCIPLMTIAKSVGPLLPLLLTQQPCPRLSGGQCGSAGCRDGGGCAGVGAGP